MTPFLTNISAALASGLLASLHCAAMCGPLALAGCSNQGVLHGKSTLGYFGGRLIAYSAVGAVLGHLGKHALCILPMNTIQNIALVSVALLSAARGISILRAKNSNSKELIPLRLEKTQKRGSILSLLFETLPKRGLGLGLITGFLPCGVLFMAWALAAGTASPEQGALSMMLFCVASMPGLIVPLAGRKLIMRASAHLPKTAYGLLWCALALWLAVRPLFTEAHCAN